MNEYRPEVVKEVVDIAKDYKRMGYEAPTDSAVAFWENHLKKMFDPSLSERELKAITRKAK